MQARDILAIKGAVLYTVSPDNKLSEAIVIMTGQDIGSLVCFDAGRMVGMLTFREVLKAVNDNGAAWGSVRVADVMVRDPLAAEPGMQVDDLRRIMLDKHMRYLPVMDGATLLGVISFHDVAKAVLEDQGFENRMLKAYISEWPEERATA
ncbi:CBS domain-containing protein [Sulfurisoma sediminicola]|uniref:CBS domain-containing protein n=1 Tax=Sulfurisoma sediminicola TaxID=1381557 RepID=A0A497XAE7_9PROT|nr:CBS domain-containing protein [Sulfurisoma sediminicola]RLJ62797.1 CBS domain-containing protein [Sulfurisoma sediminicola]